MSVVAKMLRPRIQLFHRLPISHPAPVRLCCAPRLRHSPSSSIRLLSTPSRLLSTTPRLSNSEPPKPVPEPQPETSSNLPPPPPPPPQQPKQQQQQQQRRRWRRRGILYAAAFLLLGTTLGSVFRATIAPPPLPAPGSPEDLELLALVRRRAAALPLVRELSSDPERWDSWDAYSGIEAPNHNNQRDRRLTSGALSGSRGLAYQRVFRRRDSGADSDEDAGECVSVVYFGGGTSGWPGVVHGGALATVLDESLGRCAILRLPARTGVTARLELTYRAPTLAEAFYVVRARPVDGSGGEKSDRKLWAEGTVETLDGRVLVEARALFVVPKGVKLAPLAVGF